MSSKKLHLTSIIFAAAIFLSVKNHCMAQDINVSGSINKDSIYSGQTFDYKLDVRMPKSYVLDWSEMKDTLSKSVEVLKRSEIKETTVNDGKEILISQTLTLTSFDTGYIEVPPVNINYYKSADDTEKQTCRTKSLDIYVSPVAIDTAAAYRPIKMPIKQNITFEETLPYAGGGIILAGLVLLIIYLIKRSKRKVSVEEEEVKPNIPAIIVAREKLSQLKESKLSLSGKSKEYYTDLTDIAREYLEGEFEIEAIEMTSDEILEEVKKLQLDDSIFNRLRDTLTTADFVKFAKASPDITQNETAFNSINTFVEESYLHHQEMIKKKAEESKAKKYDFETESVESQDKEETK